MRIRSPHAPDDEATSHGCQHHRAAAVRFRPVRMSVVTCVAPQLLVVELPPVHVPQTAFPPLSARRAPAAEWTIHLPRAERKLPVAATPPYPAALPQTRSLRDGSPEPAIVRQETAYQTYLPPPPSLERFPHQVLQQTTLRCHVLVTGRLVGGGVYGAIRIAFARQQPAMASCTGTRIR
jgi:hypothetical protein